MNATERRAGDPLRVFVAGATGAIGQALIPKLLDKGYHVTAMTRTPENAAGVERLGASPVVCDVFDRDKLMRVVAEAQPEVVINQLTELPKTGLKPRKLADYYAKNDRIRTEGTDNLLHAVPAAGAQRYIGQSVAFFYEPKGGTVKAEGEPLWTAGPEPFGAAAKAIQRMEDAIRKAADLDGVVLRYGTFYGPGTWYTPDGEIGRQMKKRQYPNIGSGEGMTSFIHIDDAAAACVAFVESGQPGIYNVVDDEPATANQWMPVFAEAIGAKPPRRVPAWLARLIAGRPLVEWATTCRGASNEKLKRELAWRPRYPSWQRGFREALA